MNNPPAPTSQPHPASSYPAGPPRPMGPPGTFRPPQQNGFRGPVAGPPGGPPGAGPVMGAGPVKPAMQRPMVNGGGMHPSASMPNFRTGAPPGPPGPPGPPRGPSPQMVPGAGGIRPSYSNSNLQSVNGQGQHQPPRPPVSQGPMATPVPPARPGYPPQQGYHQQAGIAGPPRPMGPPSIFNAPPRAGPPMPSPQPPSRFQQGPPTVSSSASQPSMGGHSMGPSQIPGPPMGAPPVTAPPVSAPPMAGPPMAGLHNSAPPMGGPPVSAPPMAAPPMGAPPMAAPPMGAPPMAAPPMGAPPMAPPPMAGQPSVSAPTMGGPPPVSNGPPVNGHGLPSAPSLGGRPVGGPVPMGGGPPQAVPGGFQAGGPQQPPTSAFNQRYPSAGPMPPLPTPTQQQQVGQGRPQQQQYLPAPSSLASRLGGLSVGGDCLDLLQNRHILPAKPTKPPKPRLQAELWNDYNCSPDIFRSTLTKIPETDALLKKSRLPLGVLIHPFRDLSHLPVIQCQTIVRCRQCRTYINPFVHFVDQRRWRCNVCYRVNELPEEFLYDPVSKSFGDPSRRPECKSATIEFIAPSEYMLRPPQPAVYVFLLDVSRQAVETGYVKVFCDSLLEELDKLPGDGRTQVAFITYDRTVHFYQMPEGATQPTQLTVCDIDDMFLPSPRDLLVNLQECNALVQQLLEELPHMVSTGSSTESALGAALQAAFKIASPTGGRISIFQHILPTIGPGALTNREASAGGDSKNKGGTELLGPSTDFYKKMALDCSGQQIAVDLFAMGSQYADIASLSGISKFSGGQVQHFLGYHTQHNTSQAAKFENALRRYLTRKIGFEAVMRIRCTRGLALHTFHGNFFVRSTDLLSLPNVNPDAGFGMQVSIEDDLRDTREVTFQAALLYTSSKGERRIRVHTLCLPTCASVSEIISGADQTAIIGMLTKFAADRACNDSMGDAREGLVVSCVDAAETYKSHASITVPQGLVMPISLKLMPLYVLACLRTPGFRNSSRTDERAAIFNSFKTLPLCHLIHLVYPDLYRVDDLTDDTEDVLVEENEEGEQVRVPQPPRLQLSFERISATGMYVLDVGDMLYLYLCRGLHQMILERIFGVTKLHEVDESITELPEMENPESEKLRTFVSWLNSSKPYQAPIKVVREDGKMRHLFVERMIEDRFEGSLSYFEFLQHLKQQMKA